MFVTNEIPKREREQIEIAKRDRSTLVWFDIRSEREMHEHVG